MPIRGESVGSAYVRIYADGSEVPGDIRRSIEDAEPGVREAGREHGKTYGEEFDKEVRKSFQGNFGDTKKGMFSDLNNSLTESLSRLELSKRFFDGPEWKKFEDRLGDEFGDAGRLAGQRLETEFRDSTNLEGIADAMRRIGPAVRRAQSDIVGQMHDDAISANRDFDETIRKMTADLDADFEQSARSAQGRADRIRDALKRVGEEIDKFSKGDDSFKHNDLAGFLRDLPGLFESAGLHSADYSDRVDELRKTLRTADPQMATYKNRINEIANVIGNLTGRGSRNNFLNFFGSVTRNLVNLGQIIPDTVSWFRRLSREVGAAEGIGESFGVAFTQIGTALASTIVGAVAFVAVIAVLLAALGPLVGLLSGLVGIVVALAGSIGLALVGAVAALMPLLLPVAGIIGGIVAAVYTYNSATGAMKKQTDAIYNSLGNLWDRFRDRALKNAPLLVEALNRVLADTHPLVDAAAKGFNRFLIDVVKGMNDSAFDRFGRRFSDFLPHAMNDLGKVATNVLSGVASLLADSIPIANRLLGWLVKITDEFANWARSKDGRREVRQFLELAGDSAKAVGGFLENATKWLFKLLDKGASTGNTIFKNMGDDFERWTTWLDDHPHAVQDWFGNAESLSHNIGDLVDNINSLIDSLDTADTRIEGNTALKGLADLIGGIAWVSFQLTENLGLLVVGLEEFFGAFEQSGLDTGKLLVDIVKLPKKLTDALVDADWSGMARATWHAILDAFKSVGDIGGSGGIGANLINTGAITRDLDKIPGVIARAFSGLDISGSVHNLLAPFTSLPGRIRQALGSVSGIVGSIFNSLPGPVQADLTRIAGFFRGLPGKISNALGTLTSTIGGKFDAAASYVSTIPGRIVGFFVGLGGKILNAIGSIDIGSLIHIPDPGPGVPYVPGIARGAMFLNGERLIRVGEDGPEAVVPLNRPLDQVDPAVRALSAIAQGLTIPSMASGGVVGRTVDASGWTIVTPSEDPAIVAQEVINKLVTQVV